VKKELPKGIMDQAEVDAEDDPDDERAGAYPETEEQAIGADNDQE